VAVQFSVCAVIFPVSHYNELLYTPSHVKHTSHQHNSRPFFSNYCFVSWRYWPPCTLHWLLVWGTHLEIHTDSLTTMCNAE